MKEPLFCFISPGFLLHRPDRRLLGKSRINKNQWFVNALYNQRTVIHALGNKGVAGVIDLFHLAIQRKLNVRIEVQEVIRIATDEKYVLIKRVLMGRPAQ